MHQWLNLFTMVAAVLNLVAVMIPTSPPRS